jgi:hypothetical protein
MKPSPLALTLIKTHRRAPQNVSDNRRVLPDAARLPRSIAGMFAIPLAVV